MLKENIGKAISGQVNREFYTSYLYLAISAYCDKLGYKGFSTWFNVQAQEEMAHALHIYDYILRNGAEPIFSEIQAPPATFDGIVDVFKQALKSEESVTQEINKIATLAMENHDHATYGFIQWFVTEQIEEEAAVNLVLQKLDLIGGNKGLMFALDQQLGTRVFVNPFPTQYN